MNPSPELLELLGTLTDGTLSADQHRRLAEILRKDPEARAYYLAHFELVASLQFGIGTLAASAAGENTSTSPEPFSLKKGRQRSFLLRGMIRCGLIGLVVVGLPLLALWCVSFRGDPNPLRAAGVAILTKSWECQWDSATPIAPGDSLNGTRVKLLTGLAELTFHSGAVLLVEAPADMELRSPMHVVLHSGHVVARVPEQAIGFVIETANANIVDRGTEFGLVVDGQNTTVQVYSGKVEAGGKEQGKPNVSHELTAGRAVRISGTGPFGPVEVPFQESRFIRRFPDVEGREPPSWAKGYGRARLEECHIVAAVGPVVIDGDLSEWDRSKEFESRCIDPYGDTYHARGMLMYDSNYLYIAADVADPFPMRNVIDPENESAFIWRGGSVQVRLSTDPALGWPIDADGWRQPRLLPRDVNERLVHLTMWYYQPRQQPCLHVAYGMDLHGAVINPAGVRGAFRKHASGRSYALEYAIPWQVLGVGPTDRGFQGGNVSAICWMVHWSDATGRLYRGHLSDILNPRENALTFQRASTWGRALWDRPARRRAD
jgi:hypothetical protein